MPDEIYVVRTGWAQRGRQMLMLHEEYKTILKLVFVVRRQRERERESERQTNRQTDSEKGSKADGAGRRNSAVIRVKCDVGFFFLCSSPQRKNSEPERRQLQQLSVTQFDLTRHPNHTFVGKSDDSKINLNILNAQITTPSAESVKSSAEQQRLETIGDQ